MNRYGDSPLGMVESALEFLRICEDEQYHNIVISMKASNTQVMVQAYRLLVQKLTERLGQQVVVENRPGAGGTVGNAFVGKARPDGYTLLFTPNPFTTAPFVMKLSAGNQYDVLNGFEPIVKTATQPLVLVASAGAGVAEASCVVRK